MLSGLSGPGEGCHDRQGKCKKASVNEAPRMQGWHEMEQEGQVGVRVDQDWETAVTGGPSGVGRGKVWEGGCRGRSDSNVIQIVFSKYHSGSKVRTD